jgi:hypothetical protein
MIPRLRALAVLAALILITYLVELHPVETRIFLLHAVVVMVIETLVRAVKFSWPEGE